MMSPSSPSTRSRGSIQVLEYTVSILVALARYNTAVVKINARRALQLRTREQNREIQKNPNLALPPQIASYLLLANSAAHGHALLHVYCG